VQCDCCWCRPLIQHKLNVLAKAGLSKDNFCDTDTHVLKVGVYILTLAVIVHLITVLKLGIYCIFVIIL